MSRRRSPGAATTTTARSFGLARAVAVAAAIAVAAAGCTDQPGAGGTTTTLPTEGAPTTSIVPVSVPGTLEGGVLASLGAVDRVPVMPVPAGRSYAVLPRAGSPAYRQVVQVAYRQLGAGPPLLLVSGEDASMAWWSPPLLQTLAQHYRVTVFDLPGVGYSGPPTAALSVDWLGDVAAGLASELGLSAPAVLGWGLGGQVAVALAERHPALVGDLVLVDTGLPTPGSVPPAAAVMARLASVSATPARLANMMFPPDQSAARLQWLRQLTEQVPDEVTTTAVSAEARLERSIWTSGALDAGLQRLHSPTLVIGASADQVFPEADTAALTGAIAGSQQYVIEGGGYAALEEDPAQVVTALEDFTR